MEAQDIVERVREQFDPVDIVHNKPPSSHLTERVVAEFKTVPPERELKTSITENSDWTVKISDTTATFIPE